MTVPVVIFTADHRHAELRAMLYLYAKYWDWPAIVYGFKPPQFPLSDNVSFVSLGWMADYPASKWSDAVIKALRGMTDDLVILLLEDYWITRQVDLRGVDLLADYMRAHRKIVRGDLTTDRLYAAGVTDIDAVGHLDIIENIPPTDYHLSLQAAIWRRDELIRFMRPNETPWQTELEGTNRMKDAYAKGEAARTVGTRQCLTRYLIAVQSGRLALDGGYQKPKPYMSEEDKYICQTIMNTDFHDSVNYAWAGMAR